MLRTHFLALIEKNIAHEVAPYGYLQSYVNHKLKHKICQQSNFTALDSKVNLNEYTYSNKMPF